jgi:epoxyqueuosine reductase QueG
MKLNDHPTVKKYLETKKKTAVEALDYQWLREVILDAGADDVGFVEIDREDLGDQKDDVLHAFRKTRSIISYVCRLNPPQLRSADRSLADIEFIALESEMERVSRNAVKALREKGIGTVVPAENFPMDMLKWPGKMWTVSHKPIAAAAGLGHIGHHRILIHPVYGSYICIGTMLIDAAVTQYDYPIEFNPCLECKLCVGVCPTGAISKTGEFEFFSCLVHAYRDRLGGFLNWVEEIVASPTMDEYRAKRDDSETMAVWQSLTHGGGYRCGYCMSICPAGEDVIGSYLEDKKGYVSSVVKPLKDREEPVYVIRGTDAENSVPKRFPHKNIKLV